MVRFEVSAGVVSALAGPGAFEAVAVVFEDGQIWWPGPALPAAIGPLEEHYFHSSLFPCLMKNSRIRSLRSRYLFLLIPNNLQEPFRSD